MNKVVSRYTIVTASNDMELAINVCRYLANGWQPIGGVSFDGPRYLQAMVKYKESEEVSDE